MKKTLLLIVFILLSSLYAIAQSLVLRGYVKDVKGDPIIGATVIVNGTTNGTATDIEGRFYLLVEPGASIIVSCIGYETQIKAVNNQRQLYIVLNENDVLLDDVVVIGYGGMQSRANVTSAISKVDVKILEDRLVSNVGAVLAGAVSGVMVQQISGRPGITPSITIRGGTDYNASGTPLVVVDGLVRYNGMQDINPETIKSIEVLKDASAAAIYGARAANGVILITTKRGEKGSTKINLSAKVGVNYLRHLDDFCNAGDYLYYVRTAFNDRNERFGGQSLLENPGTGYSVGNLYYETDAKGNKTVLDPRQDRRALYSGQYLTSENQHLLSQGWKSMIDPVTGKEIIYTDSRFSDYAFNTPTTTQEYNLSVSGGNDRGSYYANIGYYTEQGLPITTYYNRLDFNFNANYQIKSWLSSSSQVSLSDANWRDTDTWYSDNHFFGRLIAQPPTQRFQNDNGEWAQKNLGDALTIINADNYIRRNKRNKFVFSQTFDFTFNSYLSAKLTANWMFDESPIESFNRDLYIGAGNGSASYNTTRASSASFDRVLTQNYIATATYKRGFKKHNVEAMFGSEYYRTYNTGFSAAGRGALIDNFPDLEYTSSDANTRTIDSWHTEERILSFLGRVNYNYNQKYLLQFSIREDGYSKLANNRWGFFPGASAGWLMHHEEFFKPLKEVISFAKIRGGYGLSGNIPSSVGAYTTQGAYGILGQYNNESSIYMTTLSSPNLKWERTATYEIAADLGFFDNRLNVSLGYFYKLTSDKITTIEVPTSSGVSSVLSNNGSFASQGGEFTVDYKIIDDSDIKWKVSANATYVKNKVISLPENGNLNNRQGGDLIYDPITGQLAWAGGLQEGQEPYQIVTWVYEGVWQSEEQIAQEAGNLYVTPVTSYSATSRPLVGPNLIGSAGIPSNAVAIAPGDARFKDVDGNGIIDYADRVVIGSAVPKFMGGITTSFNYKNLGVHVACDYALGHWVYDSFHTWIMGMMQGEFNILADRARDSWTPDNPNALYPKLYGADQSGAGNYSRESTLSWTRGDYLALRSVSLSYATPKSWTEKLRISDLTISISGQNLAYFTKNQSFSPEAREALRSGNSVNYTLPRTFILSLSASF